ncbi:hypothetical protein ACFQ1S_22985, partial [Kibdelosporangium lantanae]
TVFVVGAAVDAGGAVEDLVALVEASGAQVLEAPMAARASFPEDHSQFAGFLKPSHQEIALALAEYDLVVVFGAPAFTEHYQPGWRFSGHYLTHCPLYVIHDDDGVLAWAPQGVALRADPAAVIRSLRTTVTPRTVENRPSPPRRDPPDAPEPGQLPTAGWIFHQLRDLMPSDALVVEEAPSHRPELHEHLPITARGSGFLTSAGGQLTPKMVATLPTPVKDAYLNGIVSGVDNVFLWAAVFIALGFVVSWFVKAEPLRDFTVASSSSDKPAVPAMAMD